MYQNVLGTVMHQEDIMVEIPVNRTAVAELNTPLTHRKPHTFSIASHILPRSGLFPAIFKYIGRVGERCGESLGAAFVDRDGKEKIWSESWGIVHHQLVSKLSLGSL